MNNFDNLIEFEHHSNDSSSKPKSNFWSKILMTVKRVLDVIISFYPVLIALLLMLSIPWIMPKINSQLLAPDSTPEIAADIIARAEKSLQKDIDKINKKLAAKIPNGYFLVINSSSNVFSLYKGNTLVKTDKCSTGSYILLKNGENQQWMFKTPKGEFRIQGKTTSPIWKKPDWAFVEDGLPVPSANHWSRYEAGVLGDYALSLGKGYLIHGTLYQRFLGLPVTHGCIRLNDASLELIYQSLNNGSKVYIY